MNKNHQFSWKCLGWMPDWNLHVSLHQADKEGEELRVLRALHHHQRDDADILRLRASSTLLSVRSVLLWYCAGTLCLHEHGL